MNCGWPIRNACRHDSEPGPQRSASVAAFEFVPLLGRIGCRLSPSQFLARHRDHGIRQLNRTLIFLTVQCLLSRLKLRSDGRDIGLISRSIKAFRLTQLTEDSRRYSMMPQQIQFPVRAEQVRAPAIATPVAAVRSCKPGSHDIKRAPETSAGTSHRAPVPVTMRGQSL